MTPKQKIFVREYLVSFNATKAAILAGYSQTTAAVIGAQNLRKINIKNEIDRVLKSNLMSYSEALNRTAAIARFDIAPYVMGSGENTVLDIDKLRADGHGHMIRKIRVQKSGTTVEWSNPDDAMQKILRAYELSRSATGKDDDPINVRFLWGDNAND